MNFAAIIGLSLRSGYALPARRPDDGTLRQPTGRGSTYRKRNAVATKPTTSLDHGFYSPEARSGGSNQRPQTVHPQGRTPIGGPFCAPIDSRKSTEALDKVLEDAGRTALGSFVASLRRDLGAVQAALELPWTTSPAEGQINRLKMLKRTMYGRAGFGLLRARVLHAT